jgi:sn-1 stearoyl-lipid 9-desaturase
MAPSVDPKGRKRDWTVTIAIATLHVLCLTAPFCFTWSGLGVMAIMWWVGGGLGITLCYHRLLTHRSFTTPKWFEYVLAIIGTINWQGGPIRWVGTHRLHHKYSDQEGDPHTPRHGFTWAHMFWVCYRDHASQNPYDAAKDLQRDKGLVFIDKYFPVFQFGFAAILFGLGYAFGSAYGSGHSPLFYGTSWLIWGTAVRAVFGYHATWFVNSASHVWGYQNFDTHDDSRNNWWVALLSFGEGWHNNHHAQQRSAAHGMKWWELDMTWWTIRALSWVGLATNIVYPKIPEKGTKGVQSDANPVVDSAGNVRQEVSAE